MDSTDDLVETDSVGSVKIAEPEPEQAEFTSLVPTVKDVDDQDKAVAAGGRTARGTMFGDINQGSGSDRIGRIRRGTN